MDTNTVLNFFSQLHMYISYVYIETRILTMYKTNYRLLLLLWSTSAVKISLFYIKYITWFIDYIYM